MKQSRFTDEQIIRLLKRAEGGAQIADLCREAGISDTTFQRWKATYGGLDVNAARRLKQLEDETRRLKQLVAELTLDHAALKDVVAKKGYGPLPGAKLSPISSSSTASRSGGPVAWSTCRVLLLATESGGHRTTPCGSGCVRWRPNGRALVIAA